MKKFINLLLVAVVFQACVYVYFDRVVLIPAATFSQQIITEANKEAIDQQKISSDQKYCAKIESAAVVFYSADNRVVKELSLQTDDSVTFFTWVPNTHLALIGISNSTSKGSTVTLRAVNLDTNSMPQEPKISGLATGAKITEVAFSPLVNVTYMLISGRTSSLVYRTDANNKLTKVFSSSTVKRIACLQNEDMLLYDNKQDGSVYAQSNMSKKKMVSPKVGKYTLIGCDKDEFIYIGRLNSTGLVTSVMKGSINGKFTDFQTLSTPLTAASITVNYDGKIQLNQ